MKATTVSIREIESALLHLATEDRLDRPLQLRQREFRRQQVQRQRVALDLVAQLRERRRDVLRVVEGQCRAGAGRIAPVYGFGLRASHRRHLVERQQRVKEHAHRPPARVAVGAEDFESAIVPAVNHSGDSDSTGAITGNLLGAAMGVEAIPERWLAPLELREAIGDMADDLATARPWCVGDESLESGYWWDRYPGCWPGDLCVGDSSRRICWCH